MSVSIRLHEMKPGQFGEFYALLAERRKLLTREGKPYFQCRFKDARRSATAAVWADSPFYAECEADWRVGTFYRLRAKFSEHDRYGPQLELAHAGPVNDRDRQEGFVEIEYLDRPRRVPADCFAELRQLGAERIEDAPLKALLLGLLDTHKDALMHLPASPRHYYPHPGGWLEHTLQVARNCLYLVEQYRAIYADAQPPLNADIVLAGAILHEIGRVRELEPSAESYDAVNPTVDGRLFGHLILGRDMVREAAVKAEGLDPQLATLLEHVILTHLALPEWGSPRLPAVPEVLIVHHADDLDAKMEMFMRCLRTDAAPGEFTERDPVLGKPLWKGRIH